MNNYDVVIVGGGFSGIYAAWRLAKFGCNIALIEANSEIGGLLNSLQWKDYWLDNGTHNFDMRTTSGKDFFSDILGDNIQTWDNHNWASTTDKTWTYGFEMPDYSEDHKSFSKQVLLDLNELNKKKLNLSKTKYYLKSYLDSHGPTLYSRQIEILKKYIGSDPKDLAVDARQSLSIFDRPKLGTDAEMVSLKTLDKFWDDRLGVTLFSGEDKFSGRNSSKNYCYPKKKGLKGFCLSAHRRLLELGVTILLDTPVKDISQNKSEIIVSSNNTQLKSKKLFWSLPEISLNKILGINVDLTKSVIPVGSCFFAFEVPKKAIKGPDYMHDFSEKRISFRYNKMGVYSAQTKLNGNTIIMAEVPSHPANMKKNLSKNMTKKVWRDICEVGFVSSLDSPIDSYSWGLPVAYTLPKVNWQKDYNKSKEIISSKLPNLHGIAYGYRGRNSFISYYDNLLHNQLTE